MHTIGIRELKAQLSKVLRDVQTGDVVLVTDRGRIVAEIRRPDAGRWPDTVSPQERALARLAADGRVRLGEAPASPYVESPLSSKEGTARLLIDTEREES